MNAEQAKFLAGYFAGLIERESATTAKVLAAVPDDKRDYKPDPKSRTAWELATHLATGDVWFLQSILDGKFAMDPAEADKAEKQFSTVADVVELLQARGAAAHQGAARAAGREADAGGGLLRHDAAAQRRLPGHRQQPRHPPPRPAGGVPARDGLEGARASTAAAPTSRWACSRGSPAPHVVSGSPRVPGAARARRRARHRRRPRRSAPGSRGDPPPRDRRRRAGAALHQRQGQPATGWSPICSAPPGAPSWRSASGRCGSSSGSSSWSKPSCRPRRPSCGAPATSALRAAEGRHARRVGGPGHRARHARRAAGRAAGDHVLARGRRAVHHAAAGLHHASRPSTGTTWACTGCRSTTSARPACTGRSARAAATTTRWPRRWGSPCRPR